MEHGQAAWALSAAGACCALTRAPSALHASAWITTAGSYRRRTGQESRVGSERTGSGGPTGSGRDGGPPDAGHAGEEADERLREAGQQPFALAPPTARAPPLPALLPADWSCSFLHCCVLQEEMAAANVDMVWRDFCAHVLIKLNDCRCVRRRG